MPDSADFGSVLSVRRSGEIICKYFCCEGCEYPGGILCIQNSKSAPLCSLLLWPAHFRFRKASPLHARVEAGHAAYAELVGIGRGALPHDLRCLRIQFLHDRAGEGCAEIDLDIAVG